MADKRLEVLKAANDHYDPPVQPGALPLRGSRRGFVGGLTILKDYVSTPQYKGVGLPIALFGVGLIAAIAAYITLSLAQMNAKNSVLDSKQHSPSMPVFYIHYGALTLSIVALLVAITIIIWRVAAL
jgi:hypothetical protein